MLKAKTNCIFASLEESPKVLNIDVESLQLYPGCNCSVAKPELLNYIIPKSGKIIKVLAGGKTLNLPCATKMPGPIASSILTAHFLMVVDMVRNHSRYGLGVMRPPTSVVSQVLQYHL